MPTIRAPSLVPTKQADTIRLLAGCLLYPSENLQFGYTLPVSLTKKFAVSKLRIFVSGENLWTGTSLTKIFDPETIGGGDEYNGNAYPLSRTFSVGLNVTL